MIRVKELMVLERILLEIESKHKFSLRFNDAYKLHEYLRKVGRITSYAFLIQDEYNKKFNDIEGLKEYHEKVMECLMDFPIENDVINFIDRINAQLENEELSNLILNIGWW